MIVNLQTIACRRPIRAADLILQRYVPIDIDCAYCICVTLNCTNEVFLWQGERVNIKQLAGHYSPIAHIDEIQIKFYGGPVGHGAWHYGTVWSFLLDHVANEILTNGYKVTKDKLRIS